MKELFEYAREMREKHVYDFTEIVDGFYKRLLPEDGKDSLAKRAMTLMKNYVETDPRQQFRIEQFE